MLSAVAFAHHHLIKWLLIRALPDRRLEFSHVVGPAFLVIPYQRAVRHVTLSNVPSHNSVDYTLSRAQVIHCLAIPYSLLGHFRQPDIPVCLL